jgi:hypothetical protein
MAAEICLSKLPQLIDDPNAEFQVLLIIKHFQDLAFSRNISSFCWYCFDTCITNFILSFKPAKSIFYRTTDGFRSVA